MNGVVLKLLGRKGAIKLYGKDGEESGQYRLP